MKDILQVCANYEAMLRKRETGRLDEEEIERQVASYRIAAIHIRQIEEATQQILDVEGVPTIYYPYYYACARALDKLQRQGFAGETMAIEAALLIGLWVGRGLIQSVLETIRTQVFNVAAPTP